jgi:hypothetical protein
MVAQAEAKMQPDTVADNLRRKAVMFVAISGWSIPVTSIAHRVGATQVANAFSCLILTILFK